MTDLPPAIPAATLIVLRDRAAGPPELLMVERAATMAFAGGAWVFPGGRVDPGDHVLATLLDADDRDEGAARVAAIRETVEEAGLAIALDPPPDAARLAELRAHLAAGTRFAEALAAERIRLHPELLVPFARWRPAHRATRLFDTRFYLARLPVNAPPPLVDGTENTRLAWRTAADALATASLIFPTRRTLERLALFDTADAACADARAHPIATITPWEELRDGVPHLCIPDGLGFPVTAVPTAGSVRG